jgi:membrane-associated phospholipid phosphatase
MILLAKIFSVVFHPFVFAPLTFLLFLIRADHPLSIKLVIFSIVVITTVIFPLIHIIYMKRHGFTSSVDIPERERRIWPFALSILNYVIALLILWKMQAARPILVLMWVYAFNTAVATIITRYWKISIHGMAFGGPVAALGQAISVNFYWSLPIALLILFSRVKLMAHTPLQVIAGTFLGFILTYIQFKLLM